MRVRPPQDFLAGFPGLRQHVLQCRQTHPEQRPLLPLRVFGGSSAATVPSAPGLWRQFGGEGSFRSGSLGAIRRRGFLPLRVFGGSSAARVPSAPGLWQQFDGEGSFYSGSSAAVRRRGFLLLQLFGGSSAARVPSAPGLWWQFGGEGSFRSGCSAAIRRRGFLPLRVFGGSSAARVPSAPGLWRQFGGEGSFRSGSSVAVRRRGFLPLRVFGGNLAARVPYAPGLRRRRFLPLRSSAAGPSSTPGPAAKVPQRPGAEGTPPPKTPGPLNLLGGPVPTAASSCLTPQTSKFPPPGHPPPCSDSPLCQFLTPVKSKARILPANKGRVKGSGFSRCTEHAQYTLSSTLLRRAL
ncbi:uncharacterized protein LOC135974943 isoform X5 [Chrysemys picta bellii]|uniref:uncharacterized protein LOC135974943 isoform X5 n=1 Tax=Chrysemys picta bellii TaxID=8478 RepID=UPI0032B26959